jgi:hypothetical protein
VGAAVSRAEVRSGQAKLGALGLDPPALGLGSACISVPPAAETVLMKC